MAFCHYYLCICLFYFAISWHISSKNIIRHFYNLLLQTSLSLWKSLHIFLSFQQCTIKAAYSMVCERREKSTCKKDANTTYVYFISYIANREEREREMSRQTLSRRRRKEIFVNAQLVHLRVKMCQCVYIIYIHTRNIMCVMFDTNFFVYIDLYNNF